MHMCMPPRRRAYTYEAVSKCSMRGYACYLYGAVYILNVYASSSTSVYMYSCI